LQRRQVVFFRHMTAVHWSFCSIDLPKTSRVSKMCNCSFVRGLMAVTVMALVADRALSDTHAPWPADWTNWSDPALWVTVGNSGNAADSQVMTDGTSGYGSVGYTYSIGKFEVTCDQYRAFLNAKASVGDPYGLYSGLMLGITRSGSGTVADPWIYPDSGGVWNNRCINSVSFWSAARFCNWVQNGQGNGDTESGAYINIGNASTFARQPGAKYVLPNENEWYKAAYYYDFGGSAKGYYDFPTRRDLGDYPKNDILPFDPGNSANFYQKHYIDYQEQYLSDPLHDITLVGEFENSASWYGTFDQGGNVYEWTETAKGTDRIVRGGSFFEQYASMLSNYRVPRGPSVVTQTLGFRLAMVPEPNSLAMLGVSVLGLLLTFAWRMTRTRPTAG
jgi:formylglycine-generating enzyme